MAGNASGVQNQITELITWNSLLNEAVIGYIFAVQSLANVYGTAVTFLVQDLVTGISHPSNGVSAINEQESQNTALLTQINNSAIAAASSLTGLIHQTADTFHNDGSGSGFSSSFRAERLTGNADNNTFEGGGMDNTLIDGEGSDSLIGGADNDTLDGGNGDDTLDGNGVDSLQGGSAIDLLVGEEVNDTLSSQASSDSLSGGAGSNSSVDVANETPSTDDDDVIGAFTSDISTLLGDLP